MGRTHYEKVVFEGLWDTVPGCRKITTKASCGTKWTKMGWAPYEKQVFERFWTPCWDAEKSSPAQVWHQWTNMGRTPYENVVFEAFLDTSPGLAPNGPKWNERPTTRLFTQGSGTPCQDTEKTPLASLSQILRRSGTP